MMTDINVSLLKFTHSLHDTTVASSKGVLVRCICEFSGPKDALSLYTYF